MDEQAKQELIVDIRRRVAEHYSKVSVPLLLSTLGQELRKDGLWPENANLNLRSVITSQPDSGLHIVRSALSSAKIAVTDDANKEKVEALIGGTRTEQAVSLGNLPRSLLLAFCTKIAPGEPLYLHRSRPHRFQSVPPDPEQIEQFWVIDPKSRLEIGEFSSVAELDMGAQLKLQTSIRDWLKEQGITEGILSARPKATLASSALARLIDAQPEHVRRSLVIPADIALLLSRRA